MDASSGNSVKSMPVEDNYALSGMLHYAEFILFNDVYCVSVGFAWSYQSLRALTGPLYYEATSYEIQLV